MLIERHRSTRPALLLAWSQQLLWHINAVFRLSTSRAYWPALLGNGHECRPSLKRREEGIPERNPPNHAELQSNHLYHNKRGSLSGAEKHFPAWQVHPTSHSQRSRRLLAYKLRLSCLSLRSYLHVTPPRSRFLSTRHMLMAFGLSTFRRASQTWTRTTPLKHDHYFGSSIVSMILGII